MSSLRNAALGACVALGVGISFGGPTPLFRATFDGYSTVADIAAGARETPGGIPPDLQMRMVSGLPGMGNVLSLTTPECVTYPIRGNFRPERGTVSFWLNPVNYTLSDTKTFQMFFSANAKDYEFYVYKYPKRPNKVLFYLRCGAVAKFVCGEVNWRSDAWHKIDVTWDPNEMSLYLDGCLAQRVRHDLPFALPLTLDAGTLALNRHEGFSPHADGHATAFDDLTVFDRKLSAQEIFEGYRRIFPDAQPQTVGADAPEPPRLTYRCLPDEQALRVSLDLYAVDMARRHDIPATLRLISQKTGRVACQTNVVFATPDAETELAFGASLTEGETYDLVAKVPEAKILSKAAFHVPDRTFLRSRAGVDDRVPSPWTPVDVQGEGVFSVLDRTYHFSRGVLPSRIVCRDAEMLADAPRFALGGAPVDWAAPRLVERREDRVVLEAEGRAGELAVQGRAELWFDGFCLLRFRFSPNGRPIEIPSLSLAWSVPREEARYLMTPVFRAWNDDRYDGTFGCDDYSQDQILWTTGVEKGLCWWCESRANWVDGASATNLHVVRGDTAARVTVDLIAKPVRLTNDLDYVMSFQATPAKRPDRLDRSRFYSAGGSFGDWTTGGWGIERGRPAPDNMRHWTSLVPQDPKAFGKYVAARKKNGMEILSYSQPALISVLDEPWDYFNAAWCRLPHARGTYLELDKKPVSVYSCCGQTGGADRQIDNIEKLLRNYPDLGGLYFDISDVKFCQNALHGHGGTDAFGKAFQTSTALALRAFFLRVGKLCHRAGRRLHVHAHNKYYPFVHTFADACWPGEEQYFAYASNPENHYLEGICEEAYQSAWSPTIRGMNVYMICQNSRASNFGEFKGQKELFIGKRAVTGALLPSLLHDFHALGGCFGASNDFADEIFRCLKRAKMGGMTFHGYWFDPHAVVGKGLRTALYTRPAGDATEPRFLLVVGNTSRTDAPTELQLDWSKTGMAPTALTDLRSGQTKTEREWAAGTLASHDFLLLTPASTPPPEAPSRENWEFRAELAQPEACAPVPTNGVTFVRAPVAGRESFRIDLSDGDAVTITAEDDEGLRRAVYHYQDRMRAGDLKNCVRKPWLKNRISRCYFGPIKRPPLNHDELMDDVDYYPDAYLARLAHEGINGLWLTVEWRELAQTSLTPRDPNAERRLAKLRRTVDKCLKYGIKTWLFSIEPRHCYDDDPLYRGHADMFGAGSPKERLHLMCPSTEKARRYVEESVCDIFARVPRLGGLVMISQGERPTTCLSGIHPVTGERFWDCPRCGSLEPWQIHNLTAESIVRGLRAAGSSADYISWMYHPSAMPTRATWVADVARHVPDGVTLAYNFESGGQKEQLGEVRNGGDYWLSYVGPSRAFAEVAAAGRAGGKGVCAKIQVGNSHELATVPFVPVPGLLYRKYRAMRAAGVTDVLQCWYFGNYPGIMNKAAGELAFEDFADGEDAFLERLAKPDWGADARVVADVWKRLSDAYADYPLSNQMQYYGPFHAGVAWPLLADVELAPLARTWKPHDAPSGDTIGEALENHSLDEAVTLAQRMAAGVSFRDAEGRDILAGLEGRWRDNHERMRDLSVIRALQIHFQSAANVLSFYQARARAVYEGREGGDRAQARTALSRMADCVRAEQDLAARLSALAAKDSRLGFHSEAEVHLYFPAKLDWRVRELDRTRTRIDAIRAALATGEAYPDSDFERTAAVCTTDGRWTAAGGGRRFRVSQAPNGDLRVEVELRNAADALTLTTLDAVGATWYRTVRISGDGSARPAKDASWHSPSHEVRDVVARTDPDGRPHVALTLSASAWGGLAHARPAWMLLSDDERCIWPEGDLLPEFRLNIGRISGRLFGRLR